MMIRPYDLPWERAWRFHGLTTELSIFNLSRASLLTLPRSMDVQGVGLDGRQAMPGDGHNPYSNALEFGLQLQAAAPGPLGLVVNVFQVVAGRRELLLQYALLVVAPTTAPFFQNVVAFSGFTADGWEIEVSTGVPCTGTVWGFAGWAPGLRLARDPLVVAFVEPVFA
jgi:hypothetical protein